MVIHPQIQLVTVKDYLETVLASPCAGLQLALAAVYENQS